MKLCGAIDLRSTNNVSVLIDYEKRPTLFYPRWDGI